MKNNALSVGYQAPAVQRAFQLLKLVAESPAEQSLTTLARNMGWSKSTTHGLIQSLLNVGALEHGPVRKKFILGPAVVDLAFQNGNYFQIADKARPILDALRDQIGETVFLGVLGRTRGIIVATAESQKSLKISAPPGTSVSLLAGALGKVYLASLPPDQAVQFIQERELPRYTEKTISDKSDYISEINQVRQNGYAVDDEEYLPGVKAVAIRVGNHRGLPLALWVVGFAGAMEKGVLPDIIHSIKKAAHNLQKIMDSKKELP
ncbi:MAG: IclR family transcriptional regulator [Pseudomonadota bacterium]